MSLNAIAHHMASKGRGDDSMLVHMTPGEVAGLQALALKHGGSLTINPETGLVEAGFLKKLLPAVIGFGLNMFAPGLGSAVGAALGTSAAVGTGIAVGGFEALRTGSLSKGLSAGLGAYGGAGLAGSMAGAGASQLIGSGAPIGVENVAGSAVPPIEQINPSNFNLSNADKLGAGFNAVKADPMAFVKDNWKYGLAAASPIIADAMIPTSTKMPTTSNQGIGAYIRPYDYNPETQGFRRIEPIKVKDGGLIALAAGGNPADDPYAQYNTLSGQSKAAYDYLMGNTASSAVAGSQPPSASQAPVFTSTQTPAKTTPDTPAVLPPGESAPTPTNTQAPTYFPPAFPTPVPIATEIDTVTDVEARERELEHELDEEENERQIERDNAEAENERVLEEARRQYEEQQADEFRTASDIDDATIRVDNPYAGMEESARASDIDYETIGNSLADSARASDIDYATIGDPYDGYGSDFTPANPSDFGADASGGYGRGALDGYYLGDLGGFGGGIRGYELNAESQAYANGGMMGYADGGVFGIGGGNGMTSTPSVNPNSSGGFSRGLAGMFGGGQLQQPAQQPAQQDLPVGYNEAPSRQYADGGSVESHLGGYSDGGRLLRGPGDGVSDSIPASIGKRRQPARLADGEFVVPARIVSELGNGSTEAGARKLYAMMDRVQKARGKTVGKGKVAANSRADKHLPA